MLNTQNILEEINFLFSDEVDEQTKEEYLDDHTHPDGYFV